MNHKEWLLADKNIQYRTINAMIKEHIVSEGMRIKEGTCKVEIFLNNHLLSLKVARKSALKRYVFTGDIVLKNKKLSQSIESLEELLQILTEIFHINISKRLYDELIHSRDSLYETYKHFYNRQTLIHQSMKFSKLPDSINFIAWLQHLQDSGITDDLSYSESLVIEGHPTHPLTKTKLPLSTNELKLYAPEFEKVIPLNIMLIEKNHVVTTAINDDQNFILNQVIPEYRDRLKCYLEPLRLNLNDYRVMLIHPWQYDHTIGEQFEEWIAKKILLPTPFTVESKATLSFHTASDLSKQLALIIRQKPTIYDYGCTVVTASLVNPNPIDNQAVVDSYLKWIENEITLDHIKHFIAIYTQTLVTPLIAYIQNYGIALEAHMQNTIVNLGPNKMKFIVRDLGGSRIDLNTLKQKVPQIDVTNESLIADTIEEVIAKFQHAVIQNQLAELIHHFNQYDEVIEEELFEIVREEIEMAIDNDKPHAEKLKKILFGSTITVKALLSMRMENKVKKYLNTKLDNPIKKEV